MATTFLLVRHADHELLGKVLAGRMAGVSLSAAGRQQAEKLARHFGQSGIAMVQSSPRQRALETARPIAAAAGLPCETAAALDEIDFGTWTGKRFDELTADARWKAWNEARGASRAPDGENMREVQGRIMAHLERLSAAHAGDQLVLVSHGDVIKAAIFHVVGAPLDAINRLEVAPASVSTIVLGSWGGKVVAVNERFAQ